MKKFQWVAYGLDMFGFVVFETEAYDINESHKQAVEKLIKNGVECDTCEPFNQSFIRNMEWLH